MSMNQANIQSDRKAYRLYAATKPTDAAPPITYGNAMMTEPYVRPVMASPRSDADNNLLHASLGLSAQVTRS